MALSYDLAIVGAGPCGLFAALKVLELQPKTKILILESGKDLHDRSPEESATGFSGAGGHSDGKLNLSTEVGGDFGEYDKDRIWEYLKEADKMYVDFGAPEKLYEANKEQLAEVQKQAAKAGLLFLSFPIRHAGTDTLLEIYTNVKNKLLVFGVEIRCNSPVNDIESLQSGGFAIHTNNKTVLSKKVLVSPGRYGAGWFATQAKKLGLNMVNNGIDIGVRIEVPNNICDHLTSIFYETKFIKMTQSDDKIRTFCMCRGGFVATETYENGLITVNGHSFQNKKSDNTNFALLSTHRFTYPFNDPVAYGNSVASLANLLNKGAIVQRLGDLKRGRRSTETRIKSSHVVPTLKEACPGDLALVFPYRTMRNILEMVESLDVVYPGMALDGTLLYGVEVKFYSTKIEHDIECRTNIPGLYVGGDGAGITRGLLQASAIGLLVGNTIAKDSSSL